MIKEILTFFTIVIFNQVSLAQFNETIRTGRPGQGTGSNAVGKNVLQMQTGFDLNKSKDYQSNNLNTNIRFGIFKRIEVNSAWAYQKEKILLEKRTGLALSSFGLRLHLIDPINKKPSVGVQLTTKLPYKTGDYTANEFGLKALLSVTKRISNKSSLLFNLVYLQPNNNQSKYWSYVVNYGFNISNKWGVFIENYTNFTRVNFDNYWDTGFSYLVNSNLQLDLFGGTSLNKKYSDLFVSIGFSGRIVSLRK